jgi:organic hydroperoxide reductase OsmC/OhrA
MSALEPAVFRFATSVRRLGRHCGRMSAAGIPDVNLGCPKVFGGNEENWTPEHLFVAAIEACIMMTFDEIAARSGVEVISYESSAEGELRTVDKVFRFSEVVVKPRIVLGAGATPEKAQKMIEKAHGRCLVTNSLVTETRVEPEIKIEAQ